MGHNPDVYVMCICVNVKMHIKNVYSKLTLQIPHILHIPHLPYTTRTFLHTTDTTYSTYTTHAIYHTCHILQEHLFILQIPHIPHIPYLPYTAGTSLHTTDTTYSTYITHAIYSRSISSYCIYHRYPSYIHNTSINFTNLLQVHQELYLLKR